VTIIRLYWNISHGNDRELYPAIPTGAERDDAEMMKQPATWAHTPSSAVLIRAFELVLMYNYVFDQLQFLIFHRGPTSFDPIKISDMEHYAELVCMFMAGPMHVMQYPSFVNGDQFVLPDPTVLSIQTLEWVLYSHQAVRSRNT